MTGEVASSLIDLAHEPGFRLGGLEVRPRELEAAKDHRRELLQRRVMQVLVALARNPGEVVSRDELIRLCWGGRVVGDDAINRCVLRLRQLGKAHDGFGIETITGIGYRLIPAATEAAESPPPPAPVTIAVLPFVNTSSDPEQEYFADGLAEELMAQLGHVGGLRVTGRTSSFAFKGRAEDLRLIGKTLGVDHVLEGSVRKAGARVRITVQLVTCADGYQLWSETFDRDLGDVLAIQENVARAVSRELGVKLAPGPQAHEYGGTGSFEAFDHFLRAGRLLLGIDPGEVAGRLDHLRQAVAIDPSYALAWATLSSTLAFRQAFNAIADPDTDLEREATAERALALAPGLGAAHIAMAWVLGDRRRWSAADAHIERAATSGSSRDSFTETNIGGFLTTTGRVRGGLHHRHAARDADPLSLGCSTLLMRSYAILEMWERFDAEYERSRDLPGAWREGEFLQLLRLIRMGAEPSVVGAQFERAGPVTAPVVREVAAAHGTIDQVRAILERQLDRGVAALGIVAQMAGAYGLTDLALEGLSRAAPHAVMSHLQSYWAPELREARQDPRFKELICAVGLPQFWRESGKWPDFCVQDGAADFEVIG